MDWIRSNKQTATLLGVFLAAALVVGFFLFKAWSSYSEARERFDSANTSLAAMKSAALYPSPENLKKKQDAVKAYASEVNKLRVTLVKLQPKQEPITETDFQAKLKSRIAEVKKLAGNITKLPADFALGFGDYTGGLPSSAEVASELSLYLDAVDAIAQTVVEAKANAIDVLERSALPSENKDSADAVPPPPPTAQSNNNAAAPGVLPAVERRTVKLTLSLDQGALQTVLNRLASVKSMHFFTAVRLLRVENEKADGPLKSVVAMKAMNNAPEIPEEAPPSVVPGEEGAAEAPKAKVIQAAKPGKEDSVAVLGQEKLKAYLEIDILRFTPIKSPAEAAK
ncbi:MAG: Amuc_1100 family pilus-like protein [Verrucomicrobiales bacterium]|nr:Amuc_1100 family pilus-like protein [Verrucomicrobiales bacterium]